MALKRFVASRLLLVASGLLILLATSNQQLASGSVQQEVYVTGTVESFGGYRFSKGFTFTIRKPGKQTVGEITVDGLYNGAYPWIMRIYTDNLHFAGVGGAVRPPSPAGLVSQDGQFVIPLFIRSPAYASDVFQRIPDLSDPGHLAYQADLAPGVPRTTDCVLMGIDPRNATWVAGEDGLLYTQDDNLLGDMTPSTPCILTLQTDAPDSAVRGVYEATLYIEIVPAP